MRSPKRRAKVYLGTLTPTQSSRLTYGGPRYDGTDFDSEATGAAWQSAPRRMALPQGETPG